MIQDIPNKNKEKIFALIGVAVVILLFIYLVYKFVGMVVYTPGFGFDPLVCLSILVLANYIKTYLETQNENIKLQTTLLQNIINNQNFLGKTSTNRNKNSQNRTIYENKKQSDSTSLNTQNRSKKKPDKFKSI